MRIIKAIMMLSVTLAMVVYSLLMVKGYRDSKKLYEAFWLKNDDSHKEEES